MQTTQEMIAAIEAFERDGAVEWRLHGKAEWCQTITPSWDFCFNDYRPIQPKPKPREPRRVFVNRYADRWGSIHASRDVALKEAMESAIETAVEFVEVLKDADGMPPVDPKAASRLDMECLENQLAASRQECMKLGDEVRRLKDKIAALRKVIYGDSESQS